jgi:hypothetical protein
MAQRTPEEPDPGDVATPHDAPADAEDADLPPLIEAAVLAAPRRRRPRWIRFIVLAALTIAAILYGVIPSLVAARSDLDLLHTASLLFLAGAVLLQVGSWVAYTALTRAILPRASSTGWPTQLSIDLTGFGVSHVIPGGGATAMGLRYGMMTRAGIPPSTVVTTTATQTVVSDVALAACYLLGAMASVPSVMAHRSLQVTALVGLAVVAGVVAGSALLVRGHAGMLDRLHEAQNRFAAWIRPRFTRVSHELVTFLRDGQRTVAAVVWAMANWLLDAACLYVCLASYNGTHIGPALVLTAYGFANLLGLLPLTPGGLGVVEGALIPLLIALGMSSPVAVLGVLTWRVLQFWLPVPVAACCYLGLRLTGRLSRRGRTGAAADPSTVTTPPSGTG